MPTPQLPSNLEIRPYLQGYSNPGGYSTHLSAPRGANVVRITLYVNAEPLTGYTHEGQRIPGVAHWQNMPSHIREIVRTSPSQDRPYAINNGRNRGGAILEMGYEVTVPHGWTMEQFRTALLETLPANLTSVRVPPHQITNGLQPPQSGVNIGNGNNIRVRIIDADLRGPLLDNMRALVADLHSPRLFNYHRDNNNGLRTDNYGIPELQPPPHTVEMRQLASLLRNLAGTGEGAFYTPWNNVGTPQQRIRLPREPIAISINPLENVRCNTTDSNARVRLNGLSPEHAALVRRTVQEACPRGYHVVDQGSILEIKANFLNWGGASDERLSTVARTINDALRVTGEQHTIHLEIAPPARTPETAPASATTQPRLLEGFQIGNRGVRDAQHPAGRVARLAVTNTNIENAERVMEFLSQQNITFEVIERPNGGSFIEIQPESMARFDRIRATRSRPSGPASLISSLPRPLSPNDVLLNMVNQGGGNHAGGHQPYRASILPAPDVLIRYESNARWTGEYPDSLTMANRVFRASELRPESHQGLMTRYRDYVTRLRNTQTFGIEAANLTNYNLLYDNVGSDLISRISNAPEVATANQQASQTGAWDARHAAITAVMNLPEFQGEAGIMRLHNRLRQVFADGNRGRYNHFLETSFRHLLMTHGGLGFAQADSLAGQLANANTLATGAQTTSLDRLNINGQLIEGMVAPEQVLPSFERIVNASRENLQTHNTPLASTLSNAEVRNIFANMVEHLPPSNHPVRQLIQRSLNNPNLNIIMLNAPSLTSNAGHSVAGTASRDHSGGSTIQLAIQQSSPALANTILLEELVHDSLSSLYNNRNSVPYQNSQDPRRALLVEAFREDHRASGRNIQQMRTDLHLEAYSGGTFHYEAVAKILVMMGEGRWTTGPGSLAERYFHLDRFVNEVILRDAAHHSEHHALPEIDATHYRQESARARRALPMTTRSPQEPRATRRSNTLTTSAGISSTPLTLWEQSLHDLPPIPEGHVRLWRAEAGDSAPGARQWPDWTRDMFRRIEAGASLEEMGTTYREQMANDPHVRGVFEQMRQRPPTGRWFAERLDMALNYYAREAADPARVQNVRIYFLDMPAEHARQCLVANLPEGHEAKVFSASFDDEYFVSEEVRNQRRLAATIDARALAHDQTQQFERVLRETRRRVAAEPHANQAQEPHYQGPIAESPHQPGQDGQTPGARNARGNSTPESVIGDPILGDNEPRISVRQPRRTTTPASSGAPSGATPTEPIHIGITPQEAALAWMFAPQQITGPGTIHSETLSAHSPSGNSGGANPNHQANAGTQPPSTPHTAPRIPIRHQVASGANAGLAIGGLAQGLLHRDGSVTGDAMTGTGAGMLAIDFVAAPVLEARAASILRAASTSGNAARSTATAANLARGATALRAVSSAAGQVLGVVGIGISAYGAATADNDVSRALHVTNIGLGTMGVMAASAGSTGVGLPVAGLMVVTSTALEVNEAHQGVVRHRNALRQAQADGVTDCYVGCHFGTNPRNLMPHVEEYRQLPNVINHLHDNGHANANLRDPAVLRPIIQRELERLRPLNDDHTLADTARPGVGVGGFWGIPRIGLEERRVSTPVPERIIMLESALRELDGTDRYIGYATRYTNAMRLRDGLGHPDVGHGGLVRDTVDGARAERLFAFMDRSFALETLRRRVDTTQATIQQAVQQDIVRGLTDAREDFQRLLAMPENRRSEFLIENAAFLRRNGVAPTSPYANSLLTYHNLLQRADALGINRAELDRLGLGFHARQAETELLDSDSLRNARHGDTLFDQDRQRFVGMLQRRAEANPQQQAAFDNAMAAQGGYERLARYYNVNMRDYGINIVSTMEALADVRDARDEAERANLIRRLERMRSRGQRNFETGAIQTDQEMTAFLAGQQTEAQVRMQLMVERQAGRLGVNLGNYGIELYRDRPENRQRTAAMFTSALQSGRFSYDFMNDSRDIVITFTDNEQMRAMSEQLHNMGIDHALPNNPLTTRQITISDRAVNGLAYLPEAVRNPSLPDLSSRRRRTSISLDDVIFDGDSPTPPPAGLPSSSPLISPDNRPRRTPQ